MNTELLLKSLDLATIATWIMIIGVAVLLYVSTHMPRKSSKKRP